MKESAMSEQQRGTTSTTRAAAAGTRLDPWYNTYADRALGMRQSEVRSLFAVANRPEVVSLAGGMPNIEGLPLEFLAEMSARLLRDRGTSILQYGSGQGNAELREMIAEVMRPDGVRGHPDDITVTTGSQQALDLISQVFVNPGDVVLIIDKTTSEAQLLKGGKVIEVYQDVTIGMLAEIQAKATSLNNK